MKPYFALLIRFGVIGPNETYSNPFISFFNNFTFPSKIHHWINSWFGTITCIHRIFRVIKFYQLKLWIKDKLKWLLHHQYRYWAWVLWVPETLDLKLMAQQTEIKAFCYMWLKIKGRIQSWNINMLIPQKVILCVKDALFRLQKPVPE